MIQPTDPDPGPVPDHPAERDDFVDRVLAILTDDPRTAQVVPLVHGMITTLAPMFSVSQDELSESPEGVGAVFEAVHDAVIRARYEMRADAALYPIGDERG